jgi:2-keto-3-deoxy-L-rhamnonate aldolase RhmA
MGKGGKVADCDYRFILITASPEIAEEAERAGIDRILVDLEMLGKKERQAGRDSVVSGHHLRDVAVIRQVLRHAELVVRVNPLHSETNAEVDGAVRGGADTVMLPMFHSAMQVEAFCRIVKGRLKVIGLVETPGALNEIDEVAAVPGLSEIHIGLNDLHLAQGMDFIFEPLADGSVDRAAALLRRREVPFGIGGVARVGEGLVPAERVLGEHLRLGSTGAILSRTFHRRASNLEELREKLDLSLETGRLRRTLEDLSRRSSEEVERDRAETNTLIRRIALEMREARTCRT